MRQPKDILKKLQNHSLQVKRQKIKEWVRAYADLESTITQLRRAEVLKIEHYGVGIDVGKLIKRLSRSKKHLERKISNTVLLEKKSIKRKIGKFTSQFSRPE